VYLLVTGQTGSFTMKHIMPLIFALIPLAAVVSACVACP
jgi:hypothetical protein